MLKKLLIIEDDQAIRDNLSQEYRDKQWKVKCAESLHQARPILVDQAFNPHVILADLGMPDGSIIEHLEEIHHAIEHSQWVFTLDSDTSNDIQRIKDLAYDILTGPIDTPRLEIILNRAFRASVTARKLQAYASIDSIKYSLDAYFGSSKAVKDLKDLLTSLSDIPISTLVITGETGTGKGLVARIIHNLGQRKDGPLVELNCAALPKDLLESQLFGHEPGAFTGATKRHRGLFEQADGGTIFLDEITEMDIELQAKLLKAIEDKKLRRLGSEKEISVDVQIFAATGANLEQAARNQKLREDLFHRLSVFCVTLPPLRERKEDLLELVPRFIAEFNEKANKTVEFVADEVWDTLSQHDWPGNVRELRNVVERCVLLSTDEHFPARWLQLSQLPTQDSPFPSTTNETFCPTHNPVHLSPPSAPSATEDLLTLPLDGSMSLEEMERKIICEALKRHDNNVTETARVLGTTRETLRYRVQKYNVLSK